MEILELWITQHLLDVFHPMLHQLHVQSSIQRGVYFIRGFFVQVQADTVILDQYDATPSVRVGLFVSENLVTAYNDDTLFDNARGFSNFRNFLVLIGCKLKQL